MELLLSIVIVTGSLILLAMAMSSLGKLRTVIEVPLFMRAVVSVNGAPPVVLGCGRYSGCSVSPY